MTECIFCRIAQGDIPAEIIHEDELALVFRDLRPQAPQHLLAIPRKHIATLEDLTESDTVIVGRLFQVARIAAEKVGIAASGYRAILNNGRDAGQEVMHIHMHVLGGRRMTWPPG
ncbi:MAG: histidine triad nucleotide-binding protein [Thiotrichales bacterium]